MGDYSADGKGIRITNDLSHSKEPFVPLREGRVTMYVCGITAYDECHIGHARCYITFDMIRRYLEFRGFEVFHIQNFTDIDDKIINRSNELGVDFLELSRRNEKAYFEVMDALNVKRATVYPRATEYVDRMIEVIKVLAEKGHAYEAGGDVFFEVSTFDAYGRMSNVDMTPETCETDARKRDRRDFALWKAAKEGEPSWESPWGRGRPGWHLECSTMATALAGPTLDIHGGGRDLVFPHHENEIAQAEAFTGSRFVNYWLHNGFVELDSEKMSKSLGNVIFIKDILKRTRPDALRLFYLSAHYRMPVTYADERLKEAEKALERFDTFFARVDELRHRAVEGGVRESVAELGSRAESVREAFTAAMDDDFNTPPALAEIFTLLRAGNSWIAAAEAEGLPVTVGEAEALGQVRGVLRELCGVLGLFGVGAAADSENEKLISDLVELLLRIRKDARSKKDWATSDAIRDELGRLGLVIEDGPSGTTWRRKR